MTRLTLAALLCLLAAPASAGMVDHLVSAPDASTLCATLAPQGLCSTDQQGNPAWAANVALNHGGPNNGSIRVILQEAVWDRTDPDPHKWTLTTPEVLAKGFFVSVARSVLDPALRDIPDNACWLISDRDAAAQGGKYALYWAYPAEDLAALRIEPFFAGSRVPDRMATAPAKTAPTKDRQDWAATGLKDDAVPSKAVGRSVASETEAKK